MAEFITISNATIVTGVTSTGTFMSVDVNDKDIGIPLYTFSQTFPDIDLIPPTPGLDLKSNNLYNNVTAYGVAVALNINSSAFCVPIFKVEQDPTYSASLKFSTPTYVTNITSTGTFMVVRIAEQDYGIPLYVFGDSYPSGVTLSGVVSDVHTIMRTNTFDVVKELGSTYLNPKIKAYSDVLLRIKRLLGWPSINLDLCDENIVEFIDQALEFYTKYAGYTEEFLVFNTSMYQRGYGIKMDTIFSSTPEMYTTDSSGLSGSFDYDFNSYRKVLDCWSFEQGESTGINTLFTLEQAMAQQTYFSYMLGNAGFDLVTWDILKGWLETRTKVLAQTPYFRFDDRTQIFRILPEPLENQNYYGVIGAYVTRPVYQLISERWILYYTLALTKIAIGQIRGKFGGMVIFGGGTLNANDILSQGINEKKELEEELLKSFGEVTPIKFFMG